MSTSAHPYSAASESGGSGFVSGALSVDESGAAVEIEAIARRG